MTRNAMLDLETLDTRPGGVVLQIGAVMFDENGVDENKTFCSLVSVSDSLELGMTISEDTQAWWEKQSLEARQVLVKARAGDAPAVFDVLDEFTEWLGKECRVWGNGADFDQPMLVAYYRAAKRPVPWKYYHSRCYRTLKSLIDIPLVRIGLHHDALDDARTQAAHAVKILKLINNDQIVAKPTAATSAELLDDLRLVVEKHSTKTITQADTLAIAQAGTLFGGHSAKK